VEIYRNWCCALRWIEDENEILKSSVRILENVEKDNFFAFPPINFIPRFNSHRAPHWAPQLQKSTTKYEKKARKPRSGQEIRISLLIGLLSLSPS
jgi:sugar (pentulose or hexulose) kinase